MSKRFKHKYRSIIMKSLEKGAIPVEIMPEEIKVKEIPQLEEVTTTNEGLIVQEEVILVEKEVTIDKPKNKGKKLKKFTIDPQEEE